MKLIAHDPTLSILVYCQSCRLHRRSSSSLAIFAAIRRASSLVNLIEINVHWPGGSHILAGKSEYASYEAVAVPTQYPGCDNLNRDISPSSKLSVVCAVRRRQLELRLCQQ
jgi:hypothetical protein